MKQKNKWLKNIIIVTIVVVLYCIPILCIYFISSEEVAQYEVENDYDFKEKAYGAIVSPVRKDVKESFIFSGVVTSDSYRIVKLPECNEEKIVFMSNEGDEVKCGEKIGYCDNIDLYSSADGIIEEIDVHNLRIKVKSFDNLIFRANVSKDIMPYIGDKMVDEKGNEFITINKSNQYVENSMTVDFKITINEYKYGEKIENLCLYTGKEYSDVLVINEDCIYNKTDKDKYYVRLCDADGVFLEEREVGYGFQCNGYVSVTGIDENDYCDMGYKYVKGNEEIPEENMETGNFDSDNENDIQ